MSPLHSPPAEPPSVYCTPSPQSRATTPSPPLAARMFMSRQKSIVKPKHDHYSFNITSSCTTSTPHIIFSPHDDHDKLAAAASTSSSNHHLVFLRRHRQTHPAVWFTAIICLIITVLIIFLVIAVLIVYAVVKPKIPVLDTSHATLNVVYFDSPGGHFNGDLTFVANISNPNKRLDIKYEHAVMELFFKDDLIASQSIRPFRQRPKEAGVVGIHFVSNMVSLPQNHAMELQRQVLSDKVFYRVRATFKVRVTLGGLHFTYWLHGDCDLQMSSPPSGSLVARTCMTKRR
uniref:NDR1/HIN1-like protein 10 n=1 Tax=Erigeron canadensis TaxID=72917 RepID=UPI001CB9A89A|nr:NDR1/HIN1-like protein 10 [Erigeron canadensis]